jgi:hypothetical protein
MNSWDKDDFWESCNIDCPPKWTMNSALKLIKTLQKKAWEAGFALSLGGGVLDRGESTNDLDLIALPSARQKNNVTELLKAFFSVQHPVNSLTLKWKGLLVFKLEGSIDLVIPINKKEVLDFNIEEIQSWGKE